ncbi:MAG: hypothetical protein ACYC35_11915 [Pirellulales bacterium]
MEVPCPECGSAVEIFKDEGSGRCPRCGHRFVNPGANFGCAQWCSLAKECLGFAPSRPATSGSTEGALAARLIQWVEHQFGEDPACIAHALRVFQNAKDLVRKEGGDPRVVLSAALLLAATKYAASASEPSTEKPDCLKGAAWEPEKLAECVELDKGTSEQVSEIVHRFRNGEVADTIEFRVVSDAETLATLAAERFAADPGQAEPAAEVHLWTQTGKNKAQSLLRL